MRVSRLRSLVAAGAIAAGVIGLTAPVAGAMPISTIQSECREASGVFSRIYEGRTVTGYTCQYRDYYGNWYIDYFDRYGNLESECDARRCYPA